MNRARSVGKSWRAGRGARDEALLGRSQDFAPLLHLVLHVLALLSGDEVLRREINPIFITLFYDGSMTAILPLNSLLN